MKPNLDRIIEIVKENNSSLSNIGVCLACGNEQDGCEPDMRKGNCEICNKNEVYGAEEILLCGLI